MKLSHKILSFMAVILLFSGCSCGDSRMAQYEKSPVDDLIRDMSNVKPFSIILYDMDADEGFNDVFRHKYRIITNDAAGNPQEKITDWKDVSESFFAENQDNMGMVIASKDSAGKLSKVASPPGYDNYVGNPRYGHWTNHNGTSFWEFYGKYAMIRDIFGFGYHGPIYYNHYTDYHRYRGLGKPYYGPASGSGYTYGTRGSYTSSMYKTSTWNRKPASFRDNIRSRVARSSSSSSRWKSGGFFGRSGSRYSSSSSSRARGSGFGK